MKKTMRKGLIYKARKGLIYDLNHENYDCYTPTDDADGRSFGECWVTDEQGNKHPKLNISPVPIHVTRLGEVIGCVHQ